MMNGIGSVGGAPDLQQMLQMKQRMGGGMPQGMEALRSQMGDAAKNVRNADGQSLYEMKDQIFASVKDSLGDGASGPGDFRDAMEQALRDNGFDPEALQSELRSSGGFGSPAGGGFPPMFGGGGLPGGGFSAGGFDPTSFFDSDPEAGADALIQELLSKLPAGSSVYEEV